MKSIKYVLLCLLALIILLLAWGVGIEPYLIDVEDEVAEIPSLPAEWQGKRIAAIADFQIGMWLGNTGTIQRIVESLIEKRPELVLIAGDFVYHPVEDEPEDIEREDFLAFDDQINEAVVLVDPLVKAGIPVYAVLGNHDYGMPWPTSVKNKPLARAVRKSLTAVGVHVLENQALVLASPASTDQLKEAKGTNPPLYLVGIGSRFANDDHVAAALAQVPDGAPRLALMHNPHSFGLFPAGTAPLALAGHTHGGQVRVPLTPDWSLMNLVSDEKIVVAGWIEGFGKPGNHLYVNRGIGFSVVPVRINAMPEVTLFTLRDSD